ncbi:Synaptogenesis protein syg-1 [Nymphon striatum]|nr:Synaptogenesis protein syg-1 [Nymphon striatum]
MNIGSYFMEMGYYKCQVRNTIGNVYHYLEAGHTVFKINGPPEILLSSSVNRRREHTRLGGSTKIEFEICSSPPVSRIIWKKNGIELQLSNLIRISEIPSIHMSGNCYKTGLDFINVYEEDGGIYSITVFNVNGKDTFETTLVIDDISGPQSILEGPSNKISRKSESVLLECIIENIRGTCMWTKDGNVIDNILEKYEYNHDSIAGDCSLLISNLSLEQDDGDWKCQVSSSSENLPLVSNPGKVTVVVAPASFYMENLETGSIVKSGDTISAESFTFGNIQCHSRQGNPPAAIQWFIDGKNVSWTKTHEEIYKEWLYPKTWHVESTFNGILKKEHNGKSISCAAYHIGYPEGHLSVNTSLNITYRPTINFVERPTEDIVEGSRLWLNVSADANPIADKLSIEFPNSTEIILPDGTNIGIW